MDGNPVIIHCILYCIFIKINLMKTYKEFLIYSSPFNPDLISSVLWELDISGINEEDDFIKVFSDGDAVKIKDIEQLLQKLLNEKVIESFSVDEHTEEYHNWNEEWEKNTNVIKVTDDIIIKPTFREYIPVSNETVIIIDPKMSFGTGEHQTTKLSLQLLHKYVKPGYRVLDVGTGTGVLAIAAVKFGAQFALGVDIDEWSEPNFVENAKLNSVEDIVEVMTCEIKDVKEKPFNLIAANIQKNILVEISTEIYNHLMDGGDVILSGLLKKDEEDILRVYTSAGFKFIERTGMDEWIAMVFSK
jgi:ribosomal protein L11 methyltransferase